MTTPQQQPPPRSARRPAFRDKPALTLIEGTVDEAAEDLRIEALLREAAPRLHRYATRRLGDAHEAEELMQEALLRAFEHREVLKSLDDVMAWSTVVVGRLVIDRLRVRGRSIAVGSGEDLPPGSRTARDTADVVTARDEARLALDALEALPRRQAAVLWAREVEGLSYDDIASRHGMTESSVRSLLLRGRRALRREFSARGGTVPVGGLAILAPWLMPLRHAHRLKLAAAGASVAAVTGAALVVVVVTPDRSAGAATPATVPSAPAHATVVHHRAAARLAEPARTTTPAVAPRASAQPVEVPTSTSTSTTLPTSTAATPLPAVAPACLGSMGVDCAAPAAAGKVFLVLPAPVAKLLPIKEPAINLGITCSRLPATPVTSCSVAP